jgi:hypothetical protein
MVALLYVFHTFSLLVACGLSAACTNLAGAPAPAQNVVPGQPVAWVPFIAEKVMVSPTGVKWVGRFYRSSSGSNNIEEERHYVWKPQSGWTSQPMQLPPGGWRPTPQLRNDRLTPHADRMEGFEVWVMRSESSVSYRAPALNMFALFSVPAGCDGSGQPECGHRYFNVQVAEPPAELFKPDPSASVLPLLQPGGIIRRK